MMTNSFQRELIKLKILSNRYLSLNHLRSLNSQIGFNNKEPIKSDILKYIIPNTKNAAENDI
jgi:hypothetical protein